MALEAASEPERLSAAVARHFKCGKATLLDREVVDYRSELKPLWNGTVFIYKLSRREWPTKVYVFQMSKNDGSAGWQAYPDLPRCPTALDAVKTALRNRWSADSGFEE